MPLPPSSLSYLGLPGLIVNKGPLLAPPATQSSSHSSQWARLDEHHRDLN